MLQWSPFQLSGHCPHNRANRPVIWSHAPRRYFTKRKHTLPNKPVFFIWCVWFMIIVPFRSPPFSLQCCRAVVPSQLSRTVLLLPTGLMERSSKIWGENASTDLKNSRAVLSRQLWDWIDQPSYRQAEVELCVCYEHVLETLSAWCYVMIISKGWGTEWRQQMHVQNEIVLLLGKPVFLLDVSGSFQNAPRTHTSVVLLRCQKTRFTVM